ncbi:MAG: 1-acyl-sn-glycerol-3-phosphate acyltransferase [Candidatus Marinimicrobia bacterium]|nr:1-acyl-sn-glycerol-3-phosphate acyltransferase [Candidatus Neomarinimicrobiota bacterium]MCH7763418.1 1-acyl-sn-glycerol-3-phosphate acyltransferase [Candidatus Neomarinimicrobiota bacterium]
MAKIWSKIILFVSGVPYSVDGLENLDPNKQYVFVSNHESAFDILLIVASLPYQLVFLSKIELRKIPFMGWAMVLGRHIFVNRKNRKAALASLETARESLKKYPRSIVIFPEGSRSLDGHMKPFKKGGIILGIQTNLPIVPMGICGTFDVVKKGTFSIQPKPIRLIIGQPIDTSEYEYNDRNQVTEILRNEIVNLKSSWTAD